MSLPAARTLVWVAQVLAVYLRFQPLVTVALILCLAIKEIAQVLVFFVPIKVIILAGSDHLPPYLVKFIGPEHRESLILALAIGTVMLFVVTFLLDALAGSLANAGGLRALNRANLLARASREQVEAPRYYTQFCRVAANLIFVLVAFAILGVLQAHVLLVLVGLIGLQYGLTVLLFYLSNPILPHTAAYWVKHNLGNYLGLLSSINLLAGFLVLLAPFLSGSGANILIALLSFLLLRQSLNGLKKCVGEIVSLAAKRYLIDPLVFRKHQAALAPELPHKQAFRNLFLKSAREELAQRALRWEPGPERSLQVHWMNTAVPGIYLFKITDSDSRLPARVVYQQQIFLPEQLSLLEHEEFLFRHVEREVLLAPPVIARSQEAIFHYQICAAGLGKHLTGNDWTKTLPDILPRLWSVEPPRSLVKAFLSSRRILSRRLTDDFVGRASIAVDESQEAQSLKLLLAALPQVRERLEALPLIIHNPHFTARATLARQNGLPYIMHWVNWSLEPIGYGLPLAWKDAELMALQGQLSRCHQRLNKVPTVHELRLVAECQRLESAISLESYKDALTQVKKIHGLLRHWYQD